MLDRKGGILQEEYAAKRWFVGGVGAWSEVELEGAARQRSRTMERGRGAIVAAS